MNIYICGAISGHEAEASNYFRVMHYFLSVKFPKAKIYNPMTVPPMSSWKDYMVMSKWILRNWATHVFVIRNAYFPSSAGSKEEVLLAKELELPVQFYLLGEEDGEINCRCV